MAHTLTDKLEFMNARINHILDEALALAPNERSAVMVTLLDSLEVEGADIVSSAWADEVRKRKNELLSGATKALAWETVKARINAL